STHVTRLIRRGVDLVGAHRRGALYSSRRAPCEKPTEGARLGFGVSSAERRAWGGRVKWMELRSQRDTAASPLDGVRKRDARYSARRGPRDRIHE
ncbi:MAG: hypothetical protein M3Z35_06735, partial [Nitrospirota bacterium]|nr:hypothetical protein [Nitrospirota bacterium]